MGFMDIFKKAKDKVSENADVVADKANEGIHKAGDKIDGMTKGKFSSVIEKGEDAVKGAVSKGEDLLKGAKDKADDVVDTAKDKIEDIKDNK